MAVKLHHYGIRDKNISWIKSFLADRNQQVVLDGKTSPAAVTSGVPQGTVLKPLLLLVYINDLPSRVSSSVQLFADDGQLYRVIRDQKDAESLQLDLDHLLEWERDWQIWQMVFNPDKWEHIQITNKQNVICRLHITFTDTFKKTSKAKYLESP